MRIVRVPTQSHQINLSPQESPSDSPNLNRTSSIANPNPKENLIKFQTAKFQLMSCVSMQQQIGTRNDVPRQANASQNNQVTHSDLYWTAPTLPCEGTLRLDKNLDPLIKFLLLKILLGPPSIGQAHTTIRLPTPVQNKICMFYSRYNLHYGIKNMHNGLQVADDQKMNPHFAHTKFS